MQISVLGRTFTIGKPSGGQSGSPKKGKTMTFTAKCVGQDSAQKTLPISKRQFQSDDDIMTLIGVAMGVLTQIVTENGFHLGSCTVYDSKDKVVLTGSINRGVVESLAAAGGTSNVKFGGSVR